jgi:hypothetical protein
MHQKVITIVILAALGVAVGCGDGSRNHKEAIPRNLKGNANPDKKTPGNGADPSKNGGSTPASTTGQSNDDITKQIETLMKSGDHGEAATTTPTSLATLPDGTYSLATIDARYYTTPTGGYAEVYKEFDFANAGGTYQVSLGTSLNYGLLKGTDNKRVISFADIFTSSKDKPVTVDSAKPTVMFAAQASMDRTTLTLEKTFGQYDGSESLNLVELMAGKNATDDAKPKSVTTTMVLLASGDLRVHVSIAENIVDATVATGVNTAEVGSVTRDYVFTFKFKAADGSAAATTPAPPAAPAAPAAADSSAQPSTGNPTTDAMSAPPETSSN